MELSAKSTEPSSDVKIIVVLPLLISFNLLIDSELG